jgi:hypothetical protein
MGFSVRQKMAMSIAFSSENRIQIADLSSQILMKKKYSLSKISDLTFSSLSQSLSRPIVELVGILFSTKFSSNWLWTF